MRPFIARCPPTSPAAPASAAAEPPVMAQSSFNLLLHGYRHMDRLAAPWPHSIAEAGPLSLRVVCARFVHIENAVCAIRQDVV